MSDTSPNTSQLNEYGKDLGYSEEMWEKNRLFFEEKKDEFSEKYPDKYVAVHDGKVLNTGDNPGQLVRDLYLKYGNIPLYADKPNEEKVEIINWPIIEE